MRQNVVSETERLRDVLDEQEASLVSGPSDLANGAIVFVGQTVNTVATNQLHSLSLTGSPDGGTFTLTGQFGGLVQTTSAIAYDATASTVQSALTTIYGAGNVACSGGPLPDTPIVITFQGSLASTPVSPLSIDTTGLTSSADTPISGAVPQTQPPEGAYPTNPDRYFKVRVLALLGTEVANAPITYASLDTFRYVANLGTLVPPAGTEIRCTWAPHRWTMQYGS